MDDKEFLKITKSFPDVSDEVERVNSIKKELRLATRRVRTLKNKYGFLQELVDIKTHDDRLDSSLKSFFNDLGYTDVRKVGKKFKREDLQVWTGSKLLVIEAKGITRPTPKDHECEQVAKYMRLRRLKIKDKDIFGLFVVNHDNQKYFTKRNPTPFDKQKVEYAEAGEYGLTTTVDLLTAFFLIKTGKLTFEEFENKICSTGLIKFESKSPKTRPTMG